MKNEKLLDAFALIRFLRNEAGAEKVEKLLTASRAGHLALTISDINAGELYYTVARRAGVQQAERALASLTLFRIERLPTTWNLVIAAARVKAEFSLSYADCFAVACARERGVPIVTGDPEFKALGRLIEVEWV